MMFEMIILTILTLTFNDVDENDKLNAIMSHTDLVRPATKFCKYILETRRTLLYNVI